MGRYTLIPSILLCMFVSGCKSNEELFLDACSNGNYQKVIQILKQGVDKDMQADGMTCLMAAAGNGHADIVEKLLALDANTELTDHVGNTAIDYATHYGHQQIAEMITQQQEAKRQARQQQEEAERFASLSEQDRQQIFLELTQTWERGGEGKSELLTKYNITEEHLKAIQQEGLTNDWPTADPTPTPQPTPTPTSKKGITITQQKYGRQWPFTVSKGVLHCTPVGESFGVDLFMVLFTANGKTYAVNGTARARATRYGYHDVEEIWRDDPEFPGQKVRFPSVIIERGLSLCRQSARDRKRPSPTATQGVDTLTMMTTVFQGNYTKGQIKSSLDKALNLYNEPITYGEFSKEKAKREVPPFLFVKDNISMVCQLI